MNKDRIKLWISLLKSGKWEFGEPNMLCIEEDGKRKFSAAGVLADYVIKSEKKGRWEKSSFMTRRGKNTSHFDFFSEDGQNRNHIPETVCRWLGIYQASFRNKITAAGEFGYVLETLPFDKAIDFLKKLL